MRLEPESFVQRNQQSCKNDCVIQESGAPGSPLGSLISMRCTYQLPCRAFQITHGKQSTLHFGIISSNFFLTLRRAPGKYMNSINIIYYYFFFPACIL